MPVASESCCTSSHRQCLDLLPHVVLSKLTWYLPMWLATLAMQTTSYLVIKLTNLTMKLIKPMKPMKLMELVAVESRRDLAMKPVAVESRRDLAMKPVAVESRRDLATNPRLPVRAAKTTMAMATT